MKRLLVAVVAACLASCGILSTNTTVQLAVQAGIFAGVGAVLQHNPTEAGALAAAATTLESLASGSTTSVATLVADADAKIASLSSLNPPEKASLEEIVAVGASLLSAGAGSLPPTTKIDLTLIFADIANAANLYTTAGAKALQLRVGMIQSTHVWH